MPCSFSLQEASSPIRTAPLALSIQAWNTWPSPCGGPGLTGDRCVGLVSAEEAGTDGLSEVAAEGGARLGDVAKRRRDPLPDHLARALRVGRRAPRAAAEAERRG